jgi:uncharacterized integral membrane protein
MGKRRKDQNIPFSLPAMRMKEMKPNNDPVDHNAEENQQPATDYAAIVASGIRWIIVLAFVILVLIAIEEISIVVFGRQPSQHFTPTLIGALTGIIGGILFFFRILVQHYRNNHRDNARE